MNKEEADDFIAEVKANMDDETFDPIEVMKALGYSGGISPTVIIHDEVHEWSHDDK